MPAWKVWWVVVGTRCRFDWAGCRYADSGYFSAIWSGGLRRFQEAGESFASVIDAPLGQGIDRTTSGNSAFGVDECRSDVGTADVTSECVLQS